MGNEADPGMMPRSMIDLFAAIEQTDDPSSFSVRVSYMEGKFRHHPPIRRKKLMHSLFLYL